MQERAEPLDRRPPGRRTTPSRSGRRAGEAHRLEREQARQAHQRARERYEGLTKAELSKQLAERDLPESGTVNELIERLVEADAAH